MSNLKPVRTQWRSWPGLGRRAGSRRLESEDAARIENEGTARAIVDQDIAREIGRRQIDLGRKAEWNSPGRAEIGVSEIGVDELAPVRRDRHVDERRHRGRRPELPD